jgi:hypothetical protein
MTATNLRVSTPCIWLLSGIGLVACSSGRPASGTPGGAGSGGTAGSLIGGSGGSGGGSGGSGGLAGAGGAGGAECGVRSPPPAPGSHVDCPLDPCCASTYTEQLAKIGADGGACQGFAPLEVTTATCGGKQVWRRAANLSLYECIYNPTGVLAGSETCTDTGCLFAGDVVNDDATLCTDGGRSPNLCTADAGTDAQSCPGTAGFSCVSSCQTDVGPPIFPVCTDGSWTCPSGSVRLSTCPCGSNLPPPPDSGCTYP